MSRLVPPTELSRETLTSIVSKVQGRMYLDLDEHGTEFWNPGKEWSCCDVCQDIQDLLHEHGLVPGEEQAYEEAVTIPQGDAIQSLVEWAESHGVGPEDLDELVHDCCSATASEINNQGMAQQIMFLVDQLGESDANAQVTEIANPHQQAEQPAGEYSGDEAVVQTPEIADSSNGTEVPHFGTETQCPRSPNGKHVPDENTIHLEADGGDWYVDVNCIHCGRSGCIAKFDAERVDW